MSVFKHLAKQRQKKEFTISLLPMFERGIDSSSEMKLLTKGNAYHRELQTGVWNHMRKEQARHPQFRTHLGSGMRVIPNFRANLY